MCAAVSVCGKLGHFCPTTCTAPPEDGDCIDCCVQWCFPFLRQQAGKFESGLDAKTGRIGAQLNSAARTKATIPFIRSECTAILRLIVEPAQRRRSASTRVCAA